MDIKIFVQDRKEPDMFFYRIKNKVLREYNKWIVTNFYCFKDLITKNVYPTPKMLGIDDTLNYILTHRCSVSRFGDGEIKWILGIPQDSFQKDNRELAERLDEILSASQENHIVCIANGFGDQSLFTKETKKFWSAHMGKYRKRWLEHIDLSKQYYSTDISRCYISYSSSKIAENAFSLWKQIFANRNILIVEGAKTRLGVGNDLLNTATSVRRILVPVTNAFEKYYVILECIKSFADTSTLILMAIGPTATVLAYDLAGLGYQAIDTGHLDIEYEWYREKAKSKIAIMGKYVNEAGWLGGRNVADCSDKEYLKQIVFDLSDTI